MLVGCDIDFPSLMKHHMFIDRVCCNLELLPFRAASFDIVSLNNVAEHLVDPSKVLAEFHRIVTPDGRLIVHTPNVRSLFMRCVRLGRLVLPQRIVARLITFLEHRENDDVFPTFYRINTKTQLAKLATDAGFVVENIFLLRDRPLSYFFAPFSAGELLLMRLLDSLGMKEITGSVLLAVFKRPRAKDDLGSHQSNISYEQVLSSSNQKKKQHSSPCGNLSAN